MRHPDPDRLYFAVSNPATDADIDVGRALVADYGVEQVQYIFDLASRAMELRTVDAYRQLRAISIPQWYEPLL
jgi:hypothetical protein